MTPIFQDVPLPSQYTQIANPHIQQGRKSFSVFYYFLSVEFLQSSAQPYENAAYRPTAAVTTVTL